MWVPSWRRKQIVMYDFFFGRRVHPDEPSPGAEGIKHTDVQASSNHWTKMKGALKVSAKVQNPKKKGTGQPCTVPPPINEEVADDYSSLNRPVVTFDVREPHSGTTSGPLLLQAMSSVDFSAEEC